MKIKMVTQTNKRFTIPIPTRLALNGITAGFITSTIKKQANINIEKRKVKYFIKEFHKLRHRYGKMLLVDVESANGETVKIYL